MIRCWQLFAFMIEYLLPNLQMVLLLYQYKRQSFCLVSKKKNSSDGALYNQKDVNFNHFNPLVAPSRS
jgi:hypothetical protein